MTRINIEQKKKPSFLNITLENVKDGIYLVDYEGDYIVCKEGKNLYGFCDNDPNKKGNYNSGILKLNFEAWKDRKALYKVNKLNLNYELEESSN